MFYLIIGFRNIIKNLRRSLITMIPIIVGMIACLLTHGFFNWNMNALKESMIHKGIGHYQLFAAGFSKFGNDDPYRYLIQDAAPILKELRRIPEIELVTTRMAFSGIISSGDQSTVALGEAGNPESETKLNSYSGLKRGTNLSSGKPDGLIMGDGVARKLSAKVGQTLTLMGNMKDGGINAVDLELIGITHSGYSELDNMAVTVSLGVIQNLLNIDHSVQKIVILLKNTKDTPKILPEIRRIAQKYKLEYQDWQTLAEFYRSVKLMYDVVFEIIILIVLAIVIFTISNTVNMNLNDRIREIGTIRALGTKRIQVALIFIAESWLIGIMGGFAGLAGSYLFIGVIELMGGLPVRVNGSEQSVLMHIFFRPELIVIVSCLALFSLVAVLAAIPPSRRASKIAITDALRWI
jgi:putative ABC transport system permease protein